MNKTKRWWTSSKLDDVFGFDDLDKLLAENYPNFKVDGSLQVYDAMVSIAKHIGFRKINENDLIIDDINEMYKFIMENKNV